jgi:lipoate-protein ligase A
LPSRANTSDHRNMKLARDWRLLIDDGGPAAWNMAVDDALLTCCSADGGTRGDVHTLRIYRFSPPSVSIGAFQSLQDVDLEACRNAGIGVVRRPSGGRAVLHAGALTYSLVGPACGSVFSGSVRRSSERIAHAIRLSLLAIGAPAVQVAPPRARVSRSAACFDSAAPFELLVYGHKIAGSAQLRRGGAVLQHGSLALWPYPATVQAFLSASDAVPSAGSDGHHRCLSDLIGRCVSSQAAIESIVRGFEETFEAQLLAGVLTDDEQALAQVLRSDRYSSDVWNAQR